MLFKEKKIIVTGASRGIGKEIACHFAKEGASVALVSRNQQLLQQLQKQLLDQKKSDQSFPIFALDVGEKSAVESFASELLSSWGGIDVLVNNAGVTKDKLLLRMTEEDWDVVLQTNLKSAFLLCKAFVKPLMKSQGSIVNISSISGILGNAGQANYAASKAGIMGFTKTLSKELGSRNVRVNCIAPGYVDTEMTKMLPEAIKEKILSTVSLKRMGSSADIAEAVLFLAKARYITGQTLIVDGGMS